MSVDEIVQVRGGETGLVSRVEDCAVESAVAGVDAWLEGHLEALHKGICSARVLNNGVQIVVGIERVFPWKSLVVVICPVATTAGDWILRDEAAGVSWAKEARESESSHVSVPMITPIMRSIKVFLKVILKSEAVGNSGQRKVIDRTARRIRHLHAA